MMPALAFWSGVLTGVVLTFCLMLIAARTIEK